MKLLSTYILIFIFTFSGVRAQPGSIDWSFDTDFDFKGSETIRTAAIQNDDKIIVGGNFTIPLAFGDSPANILRLNKDGDLDISFQIQMGFNDEVYKLLIQPDGKILAIGNFTKFNNIKCEKIARLHPNGAFDNSFKPPVFKEFFSGIALQPDNKILVSGSNSWGQDCRLIRINENGSVDNTFKEVKTDFAIYWIGIKSDGNIIAGGRFKNINNTGIDYLISVSVDGTLNENFGPEVHFTKIHSLDRMIFQLDEKILLFGQFQLKNETQIKRLIRLKENGTLDSTFNSEGVFASGPHHFINVMSLQMDGKIIIGGNFSTSEGSKNIGRLNSNGSLDKTFYSGTGFDNQVFCIEPSDKNKVIIGGLFKSFNSNSDCNRFIIRLNTEDVPNQPDILIFPNPSNGLFKINSKDFITLITITDAYGNEILRTKPMAFDSEIDLIDRSPGLYFVKVFSESGSKCQKILKY